MARRCAAMCFLMAGCADRSPGLRSYRRVRGFTCTVPGDAAHIARNWSTAVRVIFKSAALSFEPTCLLENPASHLLGETHAVSWSVAWDMLILAMDPQRYSMSAIVLDLPPAGWFVIAVMPGKRRQDWVALMIDVPPDQFRTGHKARSCWVKIAGEYRDEWSARDALLDLMVTRH